MDKKSIVLVVILAVVVLFYWQILEFLGLHTPAEPQPQQMADTTRVDTVDRPPAADIAPVLDTGEAEIENIPDLSSATDQPTVDTAMIDSVLTSVDTVILNTERYRVVLTSRGGGPTSILLNDHTYRDGTRIEMLPGAVNPSPTLRFADNRYTTNKLGFVSSVAAGEYTVEGQEFNIEYVYTSEAGGVIRREFTFYPDQYHFDLGVTVENRGVLGFERQYAIEWNNPLAPTEPTLKTDYDEMRAVAMMGGSREELNEFDEGRLNEALTGTTTWAGIREKYFTAAIIPRSKAAEGVYARGEEWELATPDGNVKAREVIVGMDMNIETGAMTVSDSFTVYVGPMSYKIMDDYEVNLEDMLGIGTTPVVGWLIKPFAIGVIYALPWLHNFIPNYGVVIILFAILVKIITLPLSMKSFKSMQAMKDLQPKMKELQEKHKKNPQQLNSEMMKLYKKHGVNPMSGCLPMLPQMPIFFAMFSVFRATILLRDAPFVWFITDLSHGATGLTDPYILLVVLMVAAQFISQYFTMASTQQNKALMYAMPLMMGFFLYSFPAGLLLYWTAFSGLSLLDWFLFKRDKSKNAEVQTA